MIFPESGKHFSEFPGIREATLGIYRTQFFLFPGFAGFPGLPLPCLKFTGFAGFTGLPLPWLKFTGFTGFASEANRTTCTPVDAEEGMLDWDGSLGAIITFKKSS